MVSNRPPVRRASMAAWVNRLMSRIDDFRNPAGATIATRWCWGCEGANLTTGQAT